MLPAAVVAGVSYNDFWNMTVRELYAVIKAHTDREKALIERKEKHELICAAYSAYHAGLFSKINGKDFPRSLSEAFPNLFGGSERMRGIPVENWQEGKAEMMKIMNANNARFKRR